MSALRRSPEFGPLAEIGRNRRAHRNPLALRLLALTNRAAGAEVVELRESIPVSKTADVRVELVDKRTSSGYALDRARGFVTWSVPLKSAEQRNVDLGYAIHLPEDWVVP